MNYLAHAALSPSDSYILTSNLVKDMIKGKERSIVSPKFQSGLDLHILIDNFTDSHTVVKELKKALYIRFQKYTPVIMDIFMDYLLFLSWKNLFSIDFEVFKSKIYRDILLVKNELTEAAQHRISQLVSRDWLTAYTQLSNLDTVLFYLEKRLKFPVEIKSGGDWLASQANVMVSGFLEFYLELYAQLTTSGYQPWLRIRETNTQMI